MYDEPPTNKQGIQTNAELFVIQNIVVNLPAISGDWSLGKMANIKKNQVLLWYSNGQSELSLLDSLALGFYSDAEFFIKGSAWWF